MRASRLGLSLSFAPNATAVLDPANPCLPSLRPIGGGMSRIPCDYFMDMVQGPVPQDRPMQSLEDFYI